MRSGQFRIRALSFFGTFGLVIGVLAGSTAANATAAGNVVAWGSDPGETDVPAALTTATAIAAGFYHNLALEADGSVVAWGDDGFGQSDVPAGLTAATAIAAGAYHSLAVRADGSVAAWGDDASGQTDVPAGLTGVTAVAAGFYHSLALKSDGTVVAWGDNFNGQTDVPAGLTGVTAIAAGGYHSLALHGSYAIKGFAAPVNNGIVNVAKSGSAIPLKFRVTDANGAPLTGLTSGLVDVSSTGAPCAGGTPDVLRERGVGSSLKDMGDGYYQFNWKAPKIYAGQCRTAMVSFEGTSITAEFRFT